MFKKNKWFVQGQRVSSNRSRCLQSRGLFLDTVGLTFPLAWVTLWTFTQAFKRASWMGMWETWILILTLSFISIVVLDKLFFLWRPSCSYPSRDYIGLKISRTPQRNVIQNRLRPDSGGIKLGWQPRMVPKKWRRRRSHNCVPALSMGKESPVLSPARDRAAGWQVSDFLGTDSDILFHLCQHQQTFVECHLPGSRVTHSPGLIGETWHAQERKSQEKQHRPMPMGLLDKEAGLGEKWERL